jgi:hypothetical protein
MTIIVDICDNSAIADIFQTVVFIEDISPALRRPTSGVNRTRRRSKSVDRGVTEGWALSLAHNVSAVFRWDEKVDPDQRER